MSQDEEDATKFRLNNYNNNNCYQYNNKNNGNTKRTEMPNQHVMPLYENFTIKHNNQDHSTVERVPNKSETFNYEYRFENKTTDLITKARDNDGITLTDDYEEYETGDFLGEKQLNKKLILQKYFRSALVGPRSNIYENLCRGCNYGVFNARGPLCTFCECIVNGVNSIKSDSDINGELESLETINNIYENICELCGLIYSGDKECKCQSINKERKVLKEKVGSEELLLNKEEKKIKLSKSKSFNKSSKPKLFSNFWDTLRKPKNTTVPIKKPLEIIHHVEGFEQVFHTKDTFDLQKICELKRSGTSCSDQHIYGRLKQHDLVSSLEDFNSTQSLTQNSTSINKLQNKKPRISKPKFLRTQSSQPKTDVKISLKTPEVPVKRFLYLNDSVCQWMTSLRHEVITYNTYSDDTLCYPKSIPSKNVLISCKAPVTNNINDTLQNLKDILYNDYATDLTEIVTLRRHNSMTSWDSLEIEETEKQITTKDFYQLMVEEFIGNISNRQMLNMKAKDKYSDNVKVMAGVNNNGSHNNNNNSSSSIPLRQATLTATNNNNNRHKRQGMYLRLEDHTTQQQILEANLQNSKKTNKKEESNAEKEHKTESNNNDKEYENLLNSSNLKKDLDQDTKQTPVIKEIILNSQSLKSAKKGWDLLKTDKRQGIHELNVLEQFEALLRTEQNLSVPKTNDKETLKLQINKTESLDKELNKIESNLKPSTFGVNFPISLHFPTQILNVQQLIQQQQLSASLNTTIIYYDNYLVVFLRYVSLKNKERIEQQQLFKLTNQQLVRKFYKFYNYCQQTNAITKPKKTTRALLNNSSQLKLDLSKANAYSMKDLTEKTNESVEKSAANVLKDSEINKNTSVLANTEIKVKTPPQVPKRDPKTKLSPTTENKLILEITSQKENLQKMTKPSSNLIKETPKEEESIYQPIWKFKTKGEVTERYHIDDDYYDIKEIKANMQQDSEIPKICVTDDPFPEEEEEDHNNWEPDEEFVFTKQIKNRRSSSLTSDRNSTIRSSHSSNSSIGTSSSLSGSTITEFASSTATLASTVSSSLMHHLFRNIGIFYSLTEPKLRAIIYDYDRVHSSSYFAKNICQFHINDSVIGKSLSPLKPLKQRKSPNTPSPLSSATSSPRSLNKRNNLGKSSSSLISSESDSVSIIPPKAKVFTTTSSSPLSSAGNLVKTPSASTTPQLISNSVQAWKYQLLDVNYMEDEEDMVVSESEILRAQKIKEDIQQPLPAQPQVLQRLQRFKSLSTENILDIPNEDDKKTIAERIANMYTRFSPIQRGILNINGRNSPKSEKKAYKSNRSSQTTSLYLEDGLKPKYPIFGAPLEQLELQQNVPRFVVDAVDYIERKDRIIQDGLYRACGNKFSIDELKQKLTKSYIYDSKLIVADDIHTITSLLKQFFRDLTAPLIPQEIYTRITSNLADKQGIEAIRIAIEETREPNKSTLRFLIKHLTNVAVCSSSNRMNASNLAIVWGPSLFAQNDTYDMIGRMNTLTKVLIENYDRIFDTNERLL